MKKVFKVKEKCQQCNGTGIYAGMAERDGCGVVCHHCKGTGCHEFEHTYEDFEKRETRKDLKHVLEANPGIMVGTGNGHKFSDFGGMSYEDWLSGCQFKRGMEMRKYTCPAWWYQSTNYDLKPNWDECGWGGSFSACKQFEQKQKCWEKFDLEQEAKITK